MIIQKLKRFLRRSDGTATVETVLWFPFFIVIFGLMLDVAMILHGKSKVLRVIQEANRERAVGRLTNTTEINTYVESVLADLGVPAQSSSVVTAGVVFTGVQVKAADLQVIGFFTAFDDLELTVVSESMIENWEV